jgi:uncharacterized protein YaaQ
VAVSKLLIAVVHDLDADQVITALQEGGHRATRIPSFGGLLGIANSTLLIGAEEHQVPAILAIFERECSSRDLELPLVVIGRLKDALPRVVRHGGATVFIADLDSIVRV